LSHFIVTNNPEVKNIYDNVIFVNGSFEDVLIKVRDLTHEGVELISHPVGASIRMFYSPYRSIVVGEKKDKINPYHVETIESSITKYRAIMAGRNIDMKNAYDYALIDSELLMASLKTTKEIN